MMSDPVQIHFAGLPGVVWLWAMTLPPALLFARRAGWLLSRLREAKPEPRFNHAFQRTLHFAKHVLLQPRLFEETAIGGPHFLIFWGFVLYAICFSWSLIRGLFPFLPIPYPDDIEACSVALVLFAVLVLVALAVAALRRAVAAPPHLHRSWDANIILLLIALLMVTTLLGAGFRAAVTEKHPAGSALTSTATVLPFLNWPLATATAARWAAAMWWLHMGGVLIFLAYLPRSKHMHLLVAPFNVVFMALESKGDLGSAGPGDASGTGPWHWNQFTWKQLLSGFACAQCGRCDRACPAVASGSPLSPQQLLQNIKQLLFTETNIDRAQTAPLPPAQITNRPTPNHPGLNPTEVWACTTCGSCIERCPVWNEHLPIIIQMRRRFVNDGSLPPRLPELLANLTRYGNAFGKSDRLRGRWTQALDFKIKDARKEAVEFLWIVGDDASYDPRLEESTCLTARLLREAKVDFGLLYEAERDTGNDVRRIGEEGLFETLRDHNLQALAKTRFHHILTTDPHALNTLKNEYPWNGNRPRIWHYTELLDHLLEEGRLSVRQPLAEKVAFHDPCYLGRYNGIYDAPRRLLTRLGCHLVEMPRHRGWSYCCGAGGGRLWMQDTRTEQERPAENRIRELAALSRVGILAVACPKDLLMFSDTLKTSGYEKTIRVKDIAQLAAASTLP